MAVQIQSLRGSRETIRLRYLIEAKEKRAEEALQELKQKPVLKGMDVQNFRYKINKLFKKCLSENKQKKETITKLEEDATKAFLAEFPELLNISFNLKESRIIAFKKQIIGYYKLTYKEKSFTFGV